MIPRNRQNRKLQVNVQCPTCGMDLTSKRVSGFTRDGETYCCQGCAEGTGCTCAEPSLIDVKAARGAVTQQREPGVFHESITEINNPMKTKTAAASSKRVPSRKAETGLKPKTKRAVTKPRDSTRQQARGQSEFAGNRSGATRVSRTGTKSPRH